MTQEERDKILLDLKNGQEELKVRFDNLDRRVGNLEEGQEKLITRVGNLEEGQEKLITRVGNLEEGQEELITRVANVENGQTEIKQDLRNLSETVARIEVEHGEKLQIIMDVLTSYPQKFDSSEKRIDECESRLDKQADEIYYLNSKVQAF